MKIRRVRARAIKRGTRQHWCGQRSHQGILKTVVFEKIPRALSLTRGIFRLWAAHKMKEQFVIPRKPPVRTLKRFEWQLVGNEHPSSRKGTRSR